MTLDTCGVASDRDTSTSTSTDGAERMSIRHERDPFGLQVEQAEKACGCQGACDHDDQGVDGHLHSHSHVEEGFQVFSQAMNTGGFHLETLTDFIVSDDSTLAPPRDVISRSATEFNIQLNYSGDNAYLDEFQNAIAIWESIITGDLSDRVLDGEIIDDLLIDATIEAIDGEGNILGSAGPRNLRGENLLPFKGEMRFDEADIANIDAQGTLQAVIIHEIGHVLGIGTLWGPNWIGLVDDDFRYTGENALAEYQALTAADNDFAPVEEDFGPGTQGGHWDETLFNAELMTGFVEGGGTAMPLSRVTVGALEDLGYQVDYTPADPFSLPGGAPTDDFTADTSTTGSVTVDGPDATGTVGTGGDTDWFAVTLTAGREYTIDVRGSDTGGGTLPDAYIHGVYDTAGNFVAGSEDNDSGSGDDAQLVFTAGSSGTYYISAGAYAARVGTYSVSVEANDGPIAVLDAGGIQVGTTTTIADAFDLTEDSFDVVVAAGYAEAAEAVTVEDNALTLQMIAGLSTPTVTLGAAVTLFTAAGAGDVWATGNSANNVINGSDGQNMFSGAGGADKLVGRGGNDTLDGGTGDDTLSGGSGNDSIEGGDNADQLLGNGDMDTLTGGLGEDSIFGGAQGDTVNGGEGADSVLGQGGDDLINGDAGNDILRGGSGNDQINGGADNDMLYGNGNNDTIDGGGGNDLLQGAAGADVLSGGLGDDTLSGGLGGDVLEGGEGNDLMNGGSADGALDTFVYRLGHDQDRINAFQVGTDQIELDQALWFADDPTFTEQEVVDEYGNLNVAGTILTLDFGGGDILEVQNSGGIDQSTFGADITFI